MPQLQDQATTRSDALALTVEIVAAHLSNNALTSVEVPTFIQTVFDTVMGLANEEKPAPAALVPAVPVKKSITDDYLICLEDGRKLKMLKRHLMSTYNLTPEQYRVKWGLGPDYPMVAPNYALKRQELAKAFGLGRKPVEPEPQTKGRRGRTKAAAAG